MNHFPNCYYDLLVVKNVILLEKVVYDYEINHLPSSLR